MFNKSLIIYRHLHQLHTWTLPWLTDPWLLDDYKLIAKTWRLLVFFFFLKKTTSLCEFLSQPCFFGSSLAAKMCFASRCPPPLLVCSQPVSLLLSLNRLNSALTSDLDSAIVHLCFSCVFVSSVEQYTITAYFRTLVDIQLFIWNLSSYMVK